MDYCSRRSQDIPYLGCNMDRLALCKPEVNYDILGVLVSYIKERYTIQKKREQGSEPPWTDNKILQENSFTCVKRWQDRTSKWMIDHISQNDNLSIEDKFLQTVLFRMYNKIETAECIGLGTGFNLGDKDYNCKAIIDRYGKSDAYNRAFKMVGLKNGLKSLYLDVPYNLLPYVFVYDLATVDRNLLSNIFKDNKFREDINALDIFSLFKDIPGVGDFMAYQLFVDITYMPECPISENEFVNGNGPGCNAGLHMVYKYSDGLSNNELLFSLRDRFDSLANEVDPSFDMNTLFDNLDECNRRLTVMDIENIMCELSKYVYISEGRHKRIRKYIYNKGE